MYISENVVSMAQANGRLQGWRTSFLPPYLPLQQILAASAAASSRPFRTASLRAGLKQYAPAAAPGVAAGAGGGFAAAAARRPSRKADVSASSCWLKWRRGQCRRCTAAHAARRSLLTDAERRSCSRPGSRPLHTAFTGRYDRLQQNNTFLVRCPRSGTPPGRR